MDSLEELPYPDEDVDYDASEIEAHKIFKPKVQPSGSLPQKSNNATSKKTNIRNLVMYTTLLFAVMNLPIVDAFILKIPYINTSLTSLIVKCLIFAVLFFVLYKSTM